MDQLRHRRADAGLRILNQDGTPAANRHVRIDQVSHRFLFGCGAFDVVEMMRTSDEAQRAFLRERMGKWLALFNYATLPFYWEWYEPEEGKTAFTETMAAAVWLRENGVRVKGHPLCWHKNCASWLMRYSDEEILRRQLERVRREVTAYKGVIDTWDAVNEGVKMPVFGKFDNAITRICREKGLVPLVKAVFSAARENCPDSVLLINDYNTGPAYENLLEELLEAEVPIGGIGIQSHQHRGYWGTEKLADVLERFSRFGLPIHFTENTLVSGDLIPANVRDLNDWHVDSWPSTPEGEERQAREMAEMYSILFRHPQVEAVTVWEFNDGRWLNAPSGLVREDNSEKPSYHALLELIHGKWETHENLRTDEEGRVRFTGFRGGYRLVCGGREAKFDLERDTDRVLTLA